MGQGWRSQPLPRHWEVIRKRVLRRDRGVCHVCTQPGATEVDHIVPAAQGGSDDMANLASIHVECHRRKTAQEANQANPMAQSRKRSAEPHPGLLGQS